LLLILNGISANFSLFLYVSKDDLNTLTARVLIVIIICVYALALPNFHFFDLLPYFYLQNEFLAIKGQKTWV